MNWQTKPISNKWNQYRSHPVTKSPLETRRSFVKPKFLLFYTPNFWLATNTHNYALSTRYIATEPNAECCRMSLPFKAYAPASSLSIPICTFNAVHFIQGAENMSIACWFEPNENASHCRIVVVTFAQLLRMNAINRAREQHCDCYRLAYGWIAA